MKSSSRRYLIAGASAVLLVLLAAVAGVVYFLTSPAFAVLAADAIVGWIEERTGATVSVGAFRADFREQLFVIDGLEIRGEEDPTSPPLLAIDRLEIGLGLRALASRRVDLRRLAIIRPSVHLAVGEDGATNMPAPRPIAGGAPAFDIAVGDLIVSEGALVVNEQRVDIDFRLAEMEGVFDYVERTGVLSGRLEWEGGVDRLDRAPIPYSLATTFDYTAGVMLVHTARIVAGDSALSLQGRIDDVLGDRRGRLEYTGQAGLDFLGYFLEDTAAEGALDVAGALEFSGRHFAAAGRARSDRLTVEGWTATAFASDFRYDFPGRELAASGLDLEILGGRARGTARVAPLPGDTRIELDLSYENVDAAQLARVYPWDGGYWIQSRARGTLAGWFEGGFERFDFSGAAVLSPATVPAPAGFQAARALRLDGATRFQARPGRLEVSDLQGRLGATTVRGQGVIGGAGLDLDIVAESSDLGELAFIHDQARGAGAFSGRLTGAPSRPDAAGRFELRGYEFRGRTIDRIAGEIETTAARIDLRDVRLTAGGAEAVVDGFYDPATGRPELDITVSTLELAEFEDWIGYPVGGRVSGQLRLTSLEPLAVEGRLQGAGLRYANTPIGDAETALAYGPTEWWIDDFTLRRGGAILSGDLLYEPGAGRIRGALDAAELRLAELRPWGAPEQLDGMVRQASFRVDGTLESPLVEGRVVVEDVNAWGQRIPELILQADNTGRRVRLSLDTEETIFADLEIDTAGAGLPFAGRASFEDYDASGLAGMPAGSVAATGAVAFTGRLSDFASIQGSGEIQSFRARLRDQQLEIPQPFTFAFDSERVLVSDIELAAEATSIEIGGAIALAPSAPLDLTVRGYVDLALLDERFADLQMRGIIVVDGQIGGNVVNPELRGVATLDEVSIAPRGLFVGLTSLNGDLFFDESTISINDVRGLAGGGVVVLRGTVGVEGAAPGDFDVRIDATNVRIRTPFGLRTVINGALALRGARENPSLEGNVDLLSLSYEEGFENFLGLFSRPGETGEGGPLDDLALSIHVAGDRNIRIENSLVRVQSRVDLDIGGTYGEPSLTGHVEVTDGILTFQGTRYEITRGNVDFIDPVSIDPLIDIQAEAELRDYRVILVVTGRGADLRLDMRSDPPLPQLEIVSLIAGGRTRDELADPSTPNAPTSEELFQGGAANILADLLQERVGSRFGLLDRLRVDPFMIGAGNRTVTRITVSEQITRDLTITYSQDLATNRQEVILIEYFLNNDTSFIASRDETGAVGLDIKLRKRFR